MQAFHASRRMIRALAGGLIAFASTTSFGAPDAAWPSRPVTIIVPGAAGGTIDIPIRLLAQKLGARLGQAIVVDNRPGSGGIIGTQAALRAPATSPTSWGG